MNTKEMTAKEIQLINKQIGMFMGWIIQIIYRNSPLSNKAISRNERTKTWHHNYPFGKGCSQKNYIAIVRYLWEQLCNDKYGDCGMYHLDWHILMKVVDYVETKNNGLDGLYGSGTTPLRIRIERLENDPLRANEYRCAILFNQHPQISIISDSRIKAVWLAMGEFAKWHNELSGTGEYIVLK